MKFLVLQLSMYIFFTGTIECDNKFNSHQCAKANYAVTALQMLISIDYLLFIQDNNAYVFQSHA